MASGDVVLEVVDCEVYNYLKAGVSGTGPNWTADIKGSTLDPGSGLVAGNVDAQLTSGGTPVPVFQGGGKKYKITITEV